MAGFRGGHDVGGPGCLHFGDMLDGLLASLGVALWGLSHGTDFVLFSWLLLWTLAAFWRMLFYNLINGFPIVWVIAMVCGGGLSSGCNGTFVGLLLG